MMSITDIVIDLGSQKKNNQLSLKLFASISRTVCLFYREENSLWTQKVIQVSAKTSLL